MNRVFRLLGLVVAFIWLQGGVFEVGRLFATEPRETGVFETPYYTCNYANYTCEEQPGCGETTCTSNQDCGMCDPDQWAACINQGGSWNSEPLCSCDMPACYEADRQQCANDWGTWHEQGCWCESCVVYSVFQYTYPDSTPLGCVDCCNREYNVTSNDLYFRYCGDHYLNAYTEGTGHFELYKDPECVWESYPWCPEDHPNPFYDCW